MLLDCVLWLAFFFGGGSEAKKLVCLVKTGAHLAHEMGLPTVFLEIP